MTDPLVRFWILLLFVAALAVCLVMSVRKPKPPRMELLAQDDARSIGDGAWAPDPRASSYTRAHPYKRAEYPASRANRRVSR